MIGEALIDFFFGLVDFVVGLLPANDPPAWVSDGSGYLATIWSYGTGLSAWIPWSLFGTVVGAVLTCVGIGFAIKVVRIVASFFTAGGGSAA